VWIDFCFLLTQESGSAAFFRQVWRFAESELAAAGKLQNNFPAHQKGQLVTIRNQLTFLLRRYI